MWISSRLGPWPARARADGLAGHLVDRLHVVALDADTGHAVTRGALGVGRDGGGHRPRHRDGPVVVLDDEHDRQPPQGGEVQRLVERALVGGSFPGDGDGDAALALPLEGERLAAGHGVALRDDARAREVGDRVEEVHVAAFAAAQAGLAPEDLGRHAVQVDAVRDGQVVRPVRPGDGVIGVQVGADAGCDGLLTSGEMHLAGDQTGPDVPLRLLVRVVIAKKRRLEGPDQHHRPVQLDARRVVHELTST